jgi:hypothetical protein
MAAPDVGTWRRQNSTPLMVELVLVDGSAVKGTVLIPRERSLRDMINGPDAFVEIDCADGGSTLYAKASVRSVKPFKSAVAA